MADELALAPADGLRVIWDRDAVGGEGAWHLDGSLDPAFEALRVVSGRVGDGTFLVLCAARPAGAAHHDEEQVAALVVGAEGELTQIEEALVSTEYSGDGSVSRVGLELYKPGGDYPLRAAGVARDSSASEGEGLRRRRAILDFRLDGNAGTAVYEIVERA